ncbi:flagellar biosynthesis anti-sigma factor FlgM [Sporosarcina sp. ANT_H38]|uniref:flagellar biosynthesis anti-sigma factor FlgM n=1 Tax=Sporosarcina sp. ANT_H38 TaxID=2597358 RepID=UPI0011F26424|nr:flagellar biosynthesis anti-sigma factor FlgM [Sporosarcina sp. ANT_H38]KAA0966796.1 flagellar biosynthesis anti-sigma factor FlgM [Sporosarcina sp. ANT_H38]
MKIQKFNVPPVNPYKANQLKTEQAEQKAKMKTDKLEISSEAKQLSEKSSFTVERNERVQELKAQVQAGTYEVNPEKLAANLVKYFKP